MVATLSVAMFSACFVLRDRFSGIAGLCGLFAFFGAGASLGYDVGQTRNAAATGTLLAIWIWWMSLVVYYAIFPVMS